MDLSSYFNTSISSFVSCTVFLLPLLVPDPRHMEKHEENNYEDRSSCTYPLVN